MTVRYLNAVSSDADYVRLMIVDEAGGQAAQLDLDIEGARALASSLLFAAEAAVQERAPSTAPTRSLKIYDGEELAFEIETAAVPLAAPFRRP